MEQSKRDEELAKDLVRRYETLKGDRSTLEGVWQEIAERVVPAYADKFFGNGLGKQTEGEQNTEKMFDSTAAVALTRFSAAMESMLTPRSQRWHRLKTDNPFLWKQKEVRLWFEEATRRLFDFRYSAGANYASQQHEVYNCLGAFGTGAMYIDRLDAGGLRYKAMHVGELFFLENHQGVVDTAFRVFTMTARQAAQKWPLDGLPEKIQQAVEKDQDETFDFLHVVMPRADVDPTKADYRGMDFASYYVALAGKTLLAESGYRSFPYAISRYTTAPGEIYGRSPAMLALPAIKTLNEEKKTLLKQGHRTVDPVLLTHDDGVLDGFSLRPGAINPGGVSMDGRPLVHALPVGNLAVGKDLMDDERLVINDAFLVTLFQILVDTPQMTATEVLERAREKGALLSPTMGRQQSEFLGPMIARELDVLMRQNLLPPMPGVLIEARGEYKIEYDSPLSRAQRAEEAAGISRLMQVAVEVAANTQNPEPLDHFNWDVIIPEMADIQGVPERWMRSMDEVQALRQGRNQAAATQQLIAAAPGAAALVKAGAVAGEKMQ